MYQNCYIKQGYFYPTNYDKVIKMNYIYISNRMMFMIHLCVKKKGKEYYVYMYLFLL